MTDDPKPYTPGLDAPPAGWDTLVPKPSLVMTGAALLAAYQLTIGGPGDPGAEALLAEIERRRLDV
ncbi:MAG: hypothetical protein ACRYFW_02865 [Janthinobacterium lividum]